MLFELENVSPREFISFSIVKGNLSLKAFDLARFFARKFERRAHKIDVLYTDWKREEPNFEFSSSDDDEIRTAISQIMDGTDT